MSSDSDDIRAQLKEISEKMHSTWEEFKKTQTQRLEEIKSNGVSQASLDEKLAKMNADLETWDAKHQELLEKLEQQNKAVDERIGKLETQLSDPGRAKTLEEEPESLKAKKAFLKWARHGAGSLDPEERKLLDRAPRTEAKALISQDDTLGGYLAPPEYVNEIIKTITEYSPVRDYARIRTTTRGSIRVPVRSASFSASWAQEYAASSRTETTGLAWGLEEIPTHELYARVDVSFEELEDSVFNLESELRMEFGEQFGVAEGTAFISGNGVGQPEGILTASGTTTRSTTGSTYTIAPADLFNAFYDLKEPYRRNAVWFFHRSTLGSIRALAGNDQFYWSPGFADTPSTILGRPYREATDLDIEGTVSYNVGICADLRRGYTIVDRIVMSVVRDPYSQAEAGAVKFVARKRVGGQVVLGEAIVKMVT